MKKFKRLFACLLTVGALLVGCLGFGGCGETTVTSLSINTMPSKTVYTIGERFSAKGLKLDAKMSDGNVVVVEYIECEFSHGRFREVVEYVTATYKEASVQIPVTVLEEGTVAVTEVDFSSDYFVSAVKLGEKFKLDASKLTVLATYSDNSTANVTDYTISMDGVDKTAEILGEGIDLTKGLHTCSIKYDKFSYDYKVGCYDENSANVKIQAENSKDTGNLTDTDKNIVEIITANPEFMRNENSTAYGAEGTGSMGTIKVGDTFKIHVTVETAGKYNFFIRLCSTSRDTKSSIMSNRVNDIFNVTINGQSFEIPDAAIGFGHTSSAWGKADWFYWNLVCLGDIQLNAGDNVIEFTCYHDNLIMTSSGSSFNLDYFAFQK